MIYLDNHSTTPLDPRVLEAMQPTLRAEFGNAASTAHRFGSRAREAVERAREQVAALIGARAEEIVFTSGATESNNLAIKGVVEARGTRPAHLVSQATEHKAVLDPCRWLERRGTRLTCLGVAADGLVDPARVEESIGEDTCLVSVMLANNETGVLQPIERIGALCRARGILFHTDAVQGVAGVRLDVGESAVDLASLSAHKIYGPKGVGALYVRSACAPAVAPLFHGGGHERGLRAGTLNVPGIVGFGEAARLMAVELEADVERVRRLRDRLWHALEAELDHVAVNGSMEHRLAGNLNVHLRFVEADKLVRAVEAELALSTGAACTTASLETSHVLRAMGLGQDRAKSSVRFGVGRFNTEAEIDAAARQVIAAVRALRARSPLYAMIAGGARPTAEDPC